MGWTFRLLLAMAPAVLPATAGAQTAADTLPERVVDRVYETINRCNVAAFNALFAPVVYGSAMEDSTVAPRRRTAQDISGWCKSPKVRFKMIHRIVLGPYVVDEQDVVEQGKAHLDIFEVRKGKIVHEWESDLFPPGAVPRP
ncbi:MAG: hypothetical protein ACJ8DC_09090 [Gemmatimonadales bacterium]